ncbi:MAG: hypothetical protein ACRBF0_18415 [Calditrichia bacterium]
MKADFNQLLLAAIVLQLLGYLIFSWLKAKKNEQRFAELHKLNQDQHTQLDRLNETVAQQQQHLANFNETAVLQQKTMQAISDSAATQQTNLESLSEAAITQQRNLSAMEKRIVEIEKAGDLYKSLFDEIPSAISKYREYMSRVRDKSLAELQRSASSMDDKLRTYKEKELESIETRERLMAELPQLMVRLHDILDPVNERLKLFSDRDKYPTGSLLSVSARRGKSLLAAIGEQSVFTSERYGEAQRNGKVEEALVEE